MRSLLGELWVRAAAVPEGTAVALGQAGGRHSSDQPCSFWRTAAWEGGDPHQACASIPQVPQRCSVFQSRNPRLSEGGRGGQ